jgi:hypothetical protein
MFFWIGLVVAFVVFVAAFGFGVRGMDEREQRPGTQRLR